MQKILRSTAASSVPVLSTSSWLKTTRRSYCFRNPNSSSSFPFSMPSSFSLSTPNPSLQCSTVSKPRSLIVCRRGYAPQKRAWAPPLRSSATWRGFRATEGLRSQEKGGVLDGSGHEEKRREVDDGSESEEENDEGVNEKKLESNNGGSRAVYRRQKGAVAASADLLTIPGVGPRNLRKLVDKGFEEVAQLKQLYRDKVYGFLTS